MHSPNVSHLSSSTSVKPERIWVCWVLLKYFLPTYSLFSQLVSPEGRIRPALPPISILSQQVFSRFAQEYFLGKKVFTRMTQAPKTDFPHNWVTCNPSKTFPKSRKNPGIMAFYLRNKVSQNGGKSLYLQRYQFLDRSGAIFQMHFYGNKIIVPLIPTLASRP